MNSKEGSSSEDPVEERPEVETCLCSYFRVRRDLCVPQAVARFPSSIE